MGPGRGWVATVNEVTAQGGATGGHGAIPARKPALRTWPLAGVLPRASRGSRKAGRAALAVTSPRPGPSGWLLMSRGLWIVRLPGKNVEPLVMSALLTIIVTRVSRRFLRPCQDPELCLVLHILLWFSPSTTLRDKFH